MSQHSGSTLYPAGCPDPRDAEIARLTAALAESVDLGLASHAAAEAEVLRLRSLVATLEAERDAAQATAKRIARTKASKLKMLDLARVCCAAGMHVRMRLEPEQRKELEADGLIKTTNAPAICAYCREPFPSASGVARHIWHCPEHPLGYVRRMAGEQWERARKAEANYRWMVEHAADQKLDGYRELGARAAAAENALDAERASHAAALADLRERAAKCADAAQGSYPQGQSQFPGSGEPYRRPHRRRDPGAADGEAMRRLRRELAIAAVSASGGGLAATLALCPPASTIGLAMLAVCAVWLVVVIGVREKP